MSFSLFHSGTKLHGETYVYYERLKDDGFETLYAKANSIFETRNNEGSDFGKIAAYFEKLRGHELDKELRLMQKVFGSSIKKADVLNDNSGKELIEAFNKCLNLEEAFRRNLALVQDTKGQKGLYTWFPFYYNKMVEKNKEAMEADIANCKDQFPDDEWIEKVMDEWTPRLVKETLEYMVTETKQENGIQGDEDYSHAYERILTVLKDTSNLRSNPFIQSFIKAYNLDDVIDIVKGQTEGNKDLLKAEGEIIGRMNKRIHSAGGLSLEGFEQMIVATVAKGVESETVKASTTATGSSGQKADLIHTFGFPTDEVSNWLESNKFGGRTENTAAIAKLQNDVLKNFKDGFIVYSSAKNYSLNANFRGYSAGVPMSLDNFQASADNLGMNVKDLVGTIMQIIPGAIRDEDEEKVKLILIRAIAAALFDDFNVIGKAADQSTATSIHMLDLQGIYIPISWFFDMIAKTFRSAQTQVNNDIVRVTISKPDSILFPTMADQRYWEAQHDGESAWNYQAKIAKESITIQYHFLQNFRKLMQNLS